jgi:hypothetical protein
MSFFEGNIDMRTYVKIEGKDVESIVQKLARLAVDSPEICVWDYNLLDMGPFWGTQRPFDPEVGGLMSQYFEMSAEEFKKKCDSNMCMKLLKLTFKQGQ